MHRAVAKCFAIYNKPAAVMWFVTKYADKNTFNLYKIETGGQTFFLFNLNFVVILNLKKTIF